MQAYEHDRMQLIETLPNHRIRISEASRLVLIDEVALVCSPGEYRLLVLFLRSPEQVIPFAQLLGEGYHPHDQLAHQNLRRQVSRIRARLWPCGLDIRCLLGRGYLLCSVSDDSES